MPFNTFYGVSNERAIGCKASNVRFLKTSSVLIAFIYIHKTNCPWNQ